MVVADAAPCGLRLCGVAANTTKAERAMGASAENFSECDSDEIVRLRRFSGLLATSASDAENDAGRKQHADTPVRDADSDTAPLARAKKPVASAQNEASVMKHDSDVHFARSLFSFFINALPHFFLLSYRHFQPHPHPKS